MATEIIETREVVDVPVVADATDRSAINLYHVVNFIVGLVEILLAFRFILRMLGANPNSGFTQFIYALSAPLMAPFAGIFPTAVAEGSVVEWSILVAMAVYALISYIVLQVVSLVLKRA